MADRFDTAAHYRAVQPSTANSRHGPGTPFRSYSPLWDSVTPDPATRTGRPPCATQTPRPLRLRRRPVPRCALRGLAVPPSDRSTSPVVDTGWDLQPERIDTLPNGTGTSDCVGRAVEGDEEAVTGRVDLNTSISLQLRADGLVVGVKQLGPSLVTFAYGPLGRANDVGKEHRGKDSVDLRCGPGASQELSDLGHRCPPTWPERNQRRGTRRTSHHRCVRQGSGPWRWE